MRTLTNLIQAETFVFLYLGLSVFAVIPNYNWAFILASVVCSHCWMMFVMIVIGISP